MLSAAGQPVATPTPREANSSRAWRIAHSESSLGWGGQEHRVLAELIGFKARGAQVWLIAPKRAEIYKRAQAAGIRVVNLPESRAAFPLSLLRFAIWLAWHKVEILNPHSSRDGWLLGIAGRLAFVPLVIRTRHIDVSYPNVFLSKHAFTTFCDHVLTTSEKITAHFSSVFKLPPARITTLPTGIELEKFSPEGPKADFENFANGSPLVGMVSVLRSWKGHQTFLEAAKLLRDAGSECKFVIVGDGPTRDAIRARITEFGLEDRVSMAGHREDVPAVLRALDLLVIPSTKHEGVPQIGLQALATKTPVIGSDVGGIPEIIIPGQTGRIFPARDAAALSNAIWAALEQPNRTRGYAEEGRQLVEQKHGLGAMMDALDDLYRSYLGAPNAL